jgi:hypothetical protein
MSLDVQTRRLQIFSELPKIKEQRRKHMKRMSDRLVQIF